MYGALCYDGVDDCHATKLSDTLAEDRKWEETEYIIKPGTQKVSLGR